MKQLLKKKVLKKVPAVTRMVMGHVDRAVFEAFQAIENYLKSIDLRILQAKVDMENNLWERVNPQIDDLRTRINDQDKLISELQKKCKQCNKK